MIRWDSFRGAKMVQHRNIGDHVKRTENHR